jgi:hypothetical protein
VGASLKRSSNSGRWKVSLVVGEVLLEKIYLDHQNLDQWDYIIKIHLNTEK